MTTRAEREAHPRLQELEPRLGDRLAERRAITRTAKRENRDELDALESQDFREISTEIKSLREQIDELKEDRARRGELENAAGRLHGGSTTSGTAGSAESIGRRFAQDAATALQRMAGGGGMENRAVISGSVDVPVFVDLPTPLMELPFPQRLIDVLGNRIAIDSYTYEYFQQTARTNNAAPVADLALKPTSTLTVQAVSGRAEIIATLSQPAPVRIYWDFQNLVSWLYHQLIGAVWDAVEQQAISGNGSGANQLGLLNTSGTTGIGFNTDVPTTLRDALIALQNLGERPTAWALNPADAAAIDLTRWGTSGGFLSEGFANNPDAVRYGSSANIFGPNEIRRVICPHIPPGTAILGDFNELALFLRHSMRIDCATQGNPTGAANDLFSTNAFVLRAEIPVGIGVLRPQAFAIAAIGGGS
jgi:HK97 family phage major capsid protein